MGNIPPEVITVCGLALGVIIVILLAAFLVLRITKGSIFGFGMLVLRMLSDPKEDEDRPAAAVQAQAHAQTHEHSAEELRAKAAALDFDAAVQKYRAEETKAVGTKKDEDD